MEMHFVLFEVIIEFLNIIQINFGFKGLIKNLIVKVAHHTVNKVMGKWLQLSVSGVM
jgi:hypothetical protein